MNDAAPPGGVEGPPLDFFVGSYAIVGQEPEGGAVYSGSAEIKIDGSNLVMTRRIGGHSTEAIGSFEVALGGEAKVLRFRSSARSAATMTCLSGTDLDNYPRLTCLWQRAGKAPASPGLEALFPTAAWKSP